MVSITAVVIMLRKLQTKKTEFDSIFICGIFVHATSPFENREKLITLLHYSLFSKRLRPMEAYLNFVDRLS